jgi:hypothetical protein
MRRLVMISMFLGLPFAVAMTYELYGWAYGLAALATLGLLWLGVLSEMAILVDDQRSAQTAAKAASEAIAKAGAVDGK